MKKTSVAIFGKGDLCIKACELVNKLDKYELSYVVPVKPEPNWTGSVLNWCRKNDVTVIHSGNYIDLDPEKYDLGISIFYDKIFSAEYINRAKRLINLHNAPLPKYRGVSPINWALKNNEEEHGVTMHEIEAGIDSGKIISQMRYSIHPDVEEVKDVYEKALKYGYVLFESTIKILDQIQSKKQEEDESSYYNEKQNALLGNRRNFTRKTSL